MEHSSLLQSLYRCRLSLVKFFLILCGVLFISLGTNAQTINYDIRLNQVGYYPNLEKKAYVVGSTTLSSFSIQSLDHTTTFFTGTFGTDRLADFSSFTTAGSYVLYVSGVGYSAPFAINSEVFKDLSAASIKGYYYKRASTAITAEHGGVYARAAGHPDTQVMIHASAASFGRPEGTIVSAPKGWYDAGDYNCYVVNSNISTYTLLAAYEHFSSYYDTLNLNIPESGNGMPDILNEIKWNLDWMLTMQDPYDGAVYDKKTTVNFSDFIMPDKDQAQRYMVGKSIASTYGFAAVMAVAYRVYLPYNAAFANQCLAASKKAYSTRTTLSDGHNPPGIYTGEYYSAQVGSWASMELYISTKDDSYYPTKYYNYSGGIPAWQNQTTLGLMSFVHHRKNLTAIGFADTTASKNKLIATANQNRSNAGYIYSFGGGWGDNSFGLNEGMMDMCAYLITKDKGYLNSAIFILDFILGKNGSGYCYVTSFGSKKVMHPHDRISSADGIVDPVPGWVVGGGGGYADVEERYDLNEVAINWNAPLVFLTGAIQSVNRNDLAAVIRVSNGAAAISSNQTPALSFGSSTVNTAAADIISITIKNTGTKELIVKSITSTSGFNLSVLSSVSPIPAGTSSTFTITATPTSLGVNTGTIEIQTNDKITPVFVLNVTVKGKPVNQPFLQVFNGTNSVSLNNNSSVLVGSEFIGSVTSPITIKLVNDGTSPLTISSVTSTVGFDINISALDETIEVDASSTFTITATPVKGGVNSGVITIQTNDPANQTFLLNVTAIGNVPMLSIEQENIVYTNNGDAYIFNPVIQGDQGQDVAFTIKNPGGSRLILQTPVITGAFNWSGGYIPAYLDPGMSSTFKLQFVPTATGVTTGTMSFATNADDTPFILKLSGTGTIVPAHRMKVSRGTDVYKSMDSGIRFTGTTVGNTSDPAAFTITNIGAEPLSVNDIVLTGSFELLQAFTATSIDVGNSITFSVVFKPVNQNETGNAVYKEETGTATIVSDVPGDSFVLNFAGAAFFPLVPNMEIVQNTTAYTSNGSAFVFPFTAQGSTSAEVIFVIRNTGNAAVNISNLDVTGPFELKQVPSSIYLPAATLFSVVFKPVDASNVTGTVIITSNVAGSPFILNLSGPGQAPARQIQLIQGVTTYASNASAFSFPETIQGNQSTSVVFTINNAGTAALTLGTLAITGPFQLTVPATTSIAAGASTTFSVVFAPITTGAFTGTVSIPNNAAGSPFVLNLSGTGTLATGTTGTLDDAAIIISPNPSNGNASIHMNGMFSNVSINIYNALGELVVSNKLGNANNTTFPLVLTDASSGMYIVEIITDQGSSMERVVKE